MIRALFELLMWQRRLILRVFRLYNPLVIRAVEKTLNDYRPEITEEYYRLSKNIISRRFMGSFVGLLGFLTLVVVGLLLLRVQIVFGLGVMILFLTYEISSLRNGNRHSSLLSAPGEFLNSVLCLFHLIFPEPEARDREILEFLIVQEENDRLVTRRCASCQRTSLEYTGEMFISRINRNGHTVRRRICAICTQREEAQRIQENEEDIAYVASLLKEEFKNLPAFVEKYFQKSSSLVRFIGERSKNERDLVEDGFILFLLSIPKRKQLSADALKDIIQSGLQHTDWSPKYFEQYSKLIPLLKKEETVSESFKNYTEEQLKRMLTNRYTCGEYFRWLHMVLVEKKETDSTCKFIRHVIENEKRPLTNPNLNQLNGLQEDGYTAKVLNTKKEYDDARQDFHNCVRSYFENNNQDIITLYHQGRPVICASYGPRLQATQVKAPYNESPLNSHRAFLDKIINRIRQ